MICKECLDSPCPVVASAKSVLGTWARERRRQLDPDACLLDTIPDPEAMNEAMDAPVKKLLGASCNCACHESE